MISIILEWGVELSLKLFETILILVDVIGDYFYTSLLTDTNGFWDEYLLVVDYTTELIGEVDLDGFILLVGKIGLLPTILLISLMKFYVV